MCTATDAEDKGISQQNVERLSRRRLKERLDLRVTAKARVQEREKGKVDWIGFCSNCGKRGHGPRDCWTKQRDEAGGEGGKGAGLASVEDEGGTDDGIGEINGFNIAALDKDEENEW